MARPKKDGKYLNVYVEQNIYDDFEKFCEDMGQSKTTATERALRLYMDAMRKNMASTTSDINNIKAQSNDTNVSVELNIAKGQSE